MTWILESLLAAKKTVTIETNKIQDFQERHSSKTRKGCCVPSADPSRYNYFPVAPNHAHAGVELPDGHGCRADMFQTIL